MKGSDEGAVQCSGNYLSKEENIWCFYLIYDSCAATGTFQKQIVAAELDRASEAFSWVSAWGELLVFENLAIFELAAPPTQCQGGKNSPAESIRFTMRPTDRLWNSLSRLFPCLNASNWGQLSIFELTAHRSKSK